MDTNRRRFKTISSSGVKPKISHGRTTPPGLFAPWTLRRILRLPITRRSSNRTVGDPFGTSVPPKGDPFHLSICSTASAGVCARAAREYRRVLQEARDQAAQRGERGASSSWATLVGTFCTRGRRKLPKAASGRTAVSVLGKCSISTLVEFRRLLTTPIAPTSFVFSF
jgi:hypothetical protein